MKESSGLRSRQEKSAGTGFVSCGLAGMELREAYVGDGLIE
jgi:hypothetical protein